MHRNSVADINEPPDLTATRSAYDLTIATDGLSTELHMTLNVCSCSAGTVTPRWPESLDFDSETSVLA